MLSPDQVGFYRENGYLAVPGVVGRERITAAAAALERLIGGSRAVAASDGVYDLEDAHRPDHPRVRRIKEPHRVDPIFAELLADPAITDMVTQLIGPDLRYEHTKLNIKPGGGGEPVEWHQDWAFYPHSNDDILEVGVMLVDCTLENGPLLMIPGSHLGPVFDHHYDGYFAGAIDPSTAGLDVSGAVPLTGEAGTVTLHHVRMVHGSESNLSDRDRPLLLLGYCAADAWPLRGDLFGDLESFNAKMVRGSPTLEPRLANVPVRMPYPPAPHQGSIFENQRLVKGRSFADAMM